MPDLWLPSQLQGTKLQLYCLVTEVTVLGLLDLSAAFDCVDHQLLLHRLHRDFGLMDTVLNWVTSFVTGRSQ